MRPLGRRIPGDDSHIQKYPFGALNISTVPTVNKVLKLPWWHWTHDQGHEGACVGFGCSMMMSIINRKRYDPFWLWNEAKIIDEWADTNPGDSNGTSVRAACDILRDKGHVIKRFLLGPKLEEGIQSNRWARSVDEIRTSLSLGIPVTIGVNWYYNFDSPKLKADSSIWIGEGFLGQVRGGHAVCIYGASDRRQAFRVKNSWGKDYPLVWLPYKTMSRLLSEYGEACLITDR